MDVATREDDLRELFDAFYPKLAGWASRLVDDPETAHDLATEAFTRLWTSWKSVNEPRSWLFMTTSNLVRDHWRKNQRERAALVRLRPVTEATDGVDVATRTTVRALVRSLPDRCRSDVLMHYFADLPIAEIATVTGRAEGTVKRSLFDARALMAGALQEAS